MVLFLFDCFDSVWTFELSNSHVLRQPKIAIFSLSEKAVRIFSLFEPVCAFGSLASACKQIFVDR